MAGVYRESKCWACPAVLASALIFGRNNGFTAIVFTSNVRLQASSKARLAKEKYALRCR